MKPRCRSVLVCTAVVFVVACGSDSQRSSLDPTEGGGASSSDGAGAGGRGRPDASTDLTEASAEATTGSAGTPALRDARADERSALIVDAAPYVADRAPNAAGILLHVTNDCPFDLWIHAAGQGAVLMPDHQHLAPGAAQDYGAPDAWPAARVTAYGSAPNAQGQPQQELDKVEMTLGNKVINYNITYVDWLGLPVEMVGIGSGADCKRVGCYVPVGDVLTGCPSGLLSGRRCLSAGNYCNSAANQSQAYCHALDAQIAACAADAQQYPGCAGAAGATTKDAYACAGFFSSSPEWCAAMNRGTTSNPNGDASLDYTTPPFNTYAQWVHSVCPGIYAFAYDDFGKSNQSGFHACSGGTQLDITFCPAG